MRHGHGIIRNKNREIIEEGVWSKDEKIEPVTEPTITLQHTEPPQIDSKTPIIESIKPADVKPESLKEEKPKANTGGFFSSFGR